MPVQRGETARGLEHQIQGPPVRLAPPRAGAPWADWSRQPCPLPRPAGPRTSQWSVLLMSIHPLLKLLPGGGGGNTWGRGLYPTVLGAYHLALC